MLTVPSHTILGPRGCHILLGYRVAEIPQRSVFRWIQFPDLATVTVATLEGWWVYSNGPHGERKVTATSIRFREPERFAQLKSTRVKLARNSILG
jgi:hypothetical protein